MRLYKSIHWVVLKGFSLNYHDMETILFAIDPYYDNLN